MNPETFNTAEMTPQEMLSVERKALSVEKNRKIADIFESISEFVVLDQKQ